MARKLTTFVISAHLIVIAFLLFSPAKKAKAMHKHIAVRTIQPKVQPKTVVSNSPKKVATVAAKPKPAQKKTAAVEKNKPTPPPQAKTIPPKKAAPQNVSKEIDAKVYPLPKPKLDVPQLEAMPLEFEESFEEDLFSFLHASLNLPEFGEVTIELTVKKDGNVARLVVIKAESQKNRTYLEQHLPAMRFPMILKEDKTFKLTFCNEI